MPENKSEKTRRKILKAAEKLFSEKGFDGASVESIARSAGVNKALIYYYFKGKRDLVDSLIADILLDLSQHLKKELAATPAPDTPPDLGRKIRLEIKYLEKKQKILNILLMEELKGASKQGHLFKCAQMVMQQEFEAYRGSQAAKQKAMPDERQFMVFEFFTGFMPILSFVALKDKWARHFGCQGEELLDHFVSAFEATHLNAHKPA